ncbi:MAG TPA: hypothetical protein O0Y06_08050 [Methanocorpusculum sp.]|nr:hypothetical protein [Methanocorpusculum sp.]HJK80837.1 hypothetical protein [Methanocorpusculum sp.]
MTPASLYFIRLCRTRSFPAAKAIMQQATEDTAVSYAELQALVGASRALFPDHGWSEW